MTTADPTPTGGSARPDGRDSRWEQHRRTRRRELVEAAITAIREHGAAVGMDEVAAGAGTSKTVIYRHLGDRLGLYLAVCEAVAGSILADFRRAMERGTGGAGESAILGDARPTLVAVIDSYLALVERDPEVYRFVTRRPLVDVPVEKDPVIGLSDTIARELTSVLGELLTEAQRDREAAATWAHALVGLVRESADRWLVDPDRPARETVVERLADLAAYGLNGVLTRR